MNTDRIFETVITDLSSKKNKLEDKLERAINKDIELEDKSELIQSLLSQLIDVELALAKFQLMINKNNEN